MARTALSTFQDRDARLTMLFVGATTSSPLAQVQNFDWTSERTSRDSYRVSDSTRYRAYLDINVSGNITLYEEDDIQELALLLGATKPTTGGWVGTEAIELAVDNADIATVTIGNYDGEATTSTLLWTEVITNMSVDSVQRSVTANEQNVWAIAFSAERVHLAPEAGMGA